MTNETVMGRILSLDEAIKFYETIAEAEKVMGRLSRSERITILAKFGEPVTCEELVTLLKTKRALIVKGDKSDGTVLQGD